MEVNVLLFGIARDIAGSGKIKLKIDEKANVGNLMDSLKISYPKLAGLKSFMIAVNNEYAKEELKLHPNDEIAVIPPVSGG